jgi:hypothetical protein
MRANEQRPHHVMRHCPDRGPRQDARILPEGFTFWVKAPLGEAGVTLQRWADEEALHVGVKFADGTKAANAARLPSMAA